MKDLLQLLSSDISTIQYLIVCTFPIEITIDPVMFDVAVSHLVLIKK